MSPSDPTASGGAAAAKSTTASNNQSILSEKVSRALQVRTDTPAMKAALDALSHLQPGTLASASAGAAAPSNNSAGNHSPPQQQQSVVVVDSRSVRVAIERDALQQALQLQKELGSLVGTVRDLRDGIREATMHARAVKLAIHANVITSQDAASNVISSGGNGGGGGWSGSSDDGEGGGGGGRESGAGADGALAAEGGHSGQQSTGDAGSMSSFENEQKLAAVLADAFAHRDAAQDRLDAVCAFLETFDLSQTDSRLLDHYNFEDVDSVLLANGGEFVNESSSRGSAEASTFPNGMAFLKALERVRNIRGALGRTFGGGSGVGDEGTSVGDSLSPSKRGGGGGGGVSGGLGTSSALRMMESLAQKQERAYERLYHWLQKYLHTFTSGSSSSSANPQIVEDRGDERLDVALQHAFVQRSLYTLRHVPAFYAHTLELVASSRRTEETRRFLLALTSGYGGMPPLEMKSHDSVSYVGDMLAFCLMALATETDIAKGLLLYVPPEEEEEQQDEKEVGDGKGVTEDQHRQGGRGEDEENWLLAEDRPMTACDMLSLSMSGLARPLKSRILQVLSTLSQNSDNDEEGEAESDDGMDDDWDDVQGNVRHRLAHLYDICGLLLFYRSVVLKSIFKLRRQQLAHQQSYMRGGGISHGSSSALDASSRSLDASQYEEMGDGGNGEDDSNNNPLLACLGECAAEGTKSYEATIRVYCARLGQMSAMTGDSEASLAHSLLVLLANARLNSPGFSKDVQCPSECQRTLSMEWVTETLTEAALANCMTLDDTVVLKQLVTVSKKAGMSILAAEQLDEKIEGKEIELIDHLVQIESAKVLDLCGLGSLASSWIRWQEEQEGEQAATLMATYPGLSQEEVETSMKEFYASLFSPPLPSLETVIKDPVLRKSARGKVAQKVCEIYTNLYASIVSTGKGGYDDISFLGHTPEQVKTLFSA